MLRSALGGWGVLDQARWRFNSGGLPSAQAQPVLILIPQTFCLHEGGVGSGGLTTARRELETHVYLNTFTLVKVHTH